VRAVLAAMDTIGAAPGTYLERIRARSLAHIATVLEDYQVRTTLLGVKHPHAGALWDAILPALPDDARRHGLLLAGIAGLRAGEGERARAALEAADAIGAGYVHAAALAVAAAPHADPRVLARMLSEVTFHSGAAATALGLTEVSDTLASDIAAAMITVPAVFTTARTEASAPALAPPETDIGPAAPGAGL
jgi:hypothetical protein